MVNVTPPDRPHRSWWVDLLIAVGLAGLLFGVVDLASEVTAPHRPAVEIDLSPWALPRYTFYSLTRGIVAYVLSLAFTLIYGYWAAKDRTAERVPYICPGWGGSGAVFVAI